MGQGPELAQNWASFSFLILYSVVGFFVLFFFSLECSPEQLPGAALPFILFKSANIAHYCKNIKNILELNA